MTRSTSPRHPSDHTSTGRSVLDVQAEPRSTLVLARIAADAFRAEIAALEALDDAAFDEVVPFAREPIVTQITA